MRIESLEVQRLKLEQYQELVIPAQHEVYVHALVGACDVGPFRTGTRKSVWDAPTSGVYLAPGCSCVELKPVGATCDVVVAMARMESEATARSRHVDPVHHQIGWDHHQRDVWEILGGNGPSERLRFGETRNARGGWSSWPPHSFDCHLERAHRFEEVFVAFTRPKHSFALMVRDGKMTDGEEFDDALVVRSGDMFQVPLGKHPIVAGPETDLVYVWAYVSPNPKVYAKWAEDIGTYR